jgi:hypothetical protein
MNIPQNQLHVLDFAGLCSLQDGVLNSPVLYSLNTNGKYIHWRIHSGIDNIEDEDNPISIPVETLHYENRQTLDENEVGVYWTSYGQEGGKLTISAKTIIYAGKNEKKNNSTTPFTQAILDARSDYMKKIRHGAKLNKQDLKTVDANYSIPELISTATAKAPWRIFAMALHDYKKFPQKIQFPATIQDKRDGTLYIVVSHPDLPITTLNCITGKVEAHIDGYSRGRETYEGQDHILCALLPFAEKYPGLHFVGELWKAGYGLQDVSGSARRKTDSAARGERIQLDFNIFDCFYLEQRNLGFTDRQKILDKIFLGDMPPSLVRIPTYIVNDTTELTTKYDNFIAAGMEGAVIRNMNAPYEFGINKEIRTYQSLKLKPREDAEWPIIGFTEGKGKESGAVIWVLAENDDGVIVRLELSPTDKLPPLSERKTFNTTPNQETSIRQHIFAKLSADEILFIENIYGRPATISYSTLSHDGLPQQPKMLHFRDPAIDEFLIA